jgi:hypothetical protein
MRRIFGSLVFRVIASALALPVPILATPEPGTAGLLIIDLAGMGLRVPPATGGRW